MEQHMERTKLKKNYDLKLLIALLAITLAHGLAYVFIIPPWQHYDEPTHFELVWLTARQKSVPQESILDQDIRRSIAISMRENDFFRDAGFEPPLEENGQIWLGYSQIGNRPLYYYLAAVPALLLENLGVTAMLYGARLVSLLCLLISVLACWGVVAELTPPGHSLRFFLPLSLALLPGYVDVMTAVNNDALAACLAALAIWICIRIIRRGFQAITILFFLVLAVLIFFSKETAFSIYPLIALAVLLMVAHGRLASLRLWIWSGIAVGITIFMIWAVVPGDAAFWYRLTNQELPTRGLHNQAILGDYVFQFDTQAGHLPDWFSAAVFQPLPAINPDHDQVFTLGAWVWNDEFSSSKNSAAHLKLGFGENIFSRVFEVTAEPQFVAITGTLTTSEYKPFRVILAPSFQENNTNQAQLIYMDGIVLAQGEFPTSQPPEFDDDQGESGVWGNQSFINLLRNPSAERSGLRLRPVLDRITARLLPDQTQGSLVLTSLLDGIGARQYYASAAQWLLVTFWGMFGWAHVPLLNSPSVRMMAGFTLTACLLTLGWIGYSLKQRRKEMTKAVNELLFLSLALILPWSSAVVRAPLYLGQVNLFLPVARYALAGFLPTIFLLNLGFVQFYRMLDRKFNTRGWVTACICVGSWLAYSIYALISIMVFYA
jgi:hypothetical protein